MKSRTVNILWIIAILLGITTYFVKFRPSQDELKNTKLAAGDLLLKNLPLTEVRRVSLSKGEHSVSLVRLNDSIEKPLWGVANRGNYSINYDLLRNLLGTLNQIKVSQSYPCESSQYGRFGLMDQSEKATDEGLRVTIFGDNDHKLTELLLGKFSGSQQAHGRFARIVGDDSGVYSISELFPGITAEPQHWLDKSFLKISNIHSITLTAPHYSQFTSWTLVKDLNPDGTPQANGQMSLKGIAENEIMKLTSTNKLSQLFQITHFTDVVSKEQATKTANPDSTLKRTATIQTTNQTLYTVTFWPQAAEGENTAQYFLTIDTSGAEDDPALKLKDHIYLVSPSTIQPLQKERADFVSKMPDGASN